MDGSPTGWTIATAEPRDWRHPFRALNVTESSDARDCDRRIICNNIGFNIASVLVRARPCSSPAPFTERDALGVARLFKRGQRSERHRVYLVHSPKCIFRRVSRAIDCITVSAVLPPASAASSLISSLTWSKLAATERRPSVTNRQMFERLSCETVLKGNVTHACRATRDRRAAISSSVSNARA